MRRSKISLSFQFEEFASIRATVGFPGGASDKESACQCKRLGFNPWVRKIPGKRKWQPTSVLLPGKSHGQRSLVDYSSWGRKESGTTEQLNNYNKGNCIQ